MGQQSGNASDVACSSSVDANLRAAMTYKELLLLTGHLWAQVLYSISKSEFRSIRLGAHFAVIHACTILHSDIIAHLS